MFWLFIIHLQGAFRTSKNQRYVCNASYVQICVLLGCNLTIHRPNTGIEGRSFVAVIRDDLVISLQEASDCPQSAARSGTISIFMWGGGGGGIRAVFTVYAWTAYCHGRNVSDDDKRREGRKPLQ
jgi:hypothetical protein